MNNELKIGDTVMCKYSNPIKGYTKGDIMVVHNAEPNLSTVICIKGSKKYHMLRAELIPVIKEEGEEDVIEKQLAKLEELEEQEILELQSGTLGRLKPTKENEKLMQKLYTSQLELYIKKNRDYGNSVELSYVDYGLVSFAIRLGDKLNRFKKLIEKDHEQLVEDENIIDTLRDLSGYSAMAVMLIEKHGLIK